MRRLRQAGPLLICAGLTGLFLVAIRGGVLSGTVESAVDDLGELVAAAAASVACYRGSRQRAPETRRSWRLLACGTGAWALGEAVWSYYELIAGQATPFPSIADIGFLVFPVLAGVGLLLWPSTAMQRGSRWRALLDGGLIGGALVIVSWATALGSTYRAAADGWFAFGVSLAYPVSDLMLLTLALMIVAHPLTRARAGLGTLAAGVACLCIADSGFAYLNATGSYGSGNLIDGGWVAGFLLIAVAARATARPRPAAGVATEVESTSAALIPYGPAFVGLAVATGYEMADTADLFIVLAATVVLVILLTRQLIAVLDNRRLASRLVGAQEELRFLAFHDPLTGLANRALFADRTRHALSLHRRDLRPLSLLYCDLDDFKAINDGMGHDVGDLVLRAFAERLLAGTRPADTVGRLGGDEFAILVEDGGDARQLTARLLDSLEQPVVATHGHAMRLAASIGVVELAAEDAGPEPDEFLQRADAAMYDAKRRGKGTVTFWSPQLAAAPSDADPLPA